MFRRKQDDPMTGSQCIVEAAPYPSSLGGVYQPGRANKRLCSCFFKRYMLITKPLKTVTHRSFRESAPGICTTVVLWQDCTDSTIQEITLSIKHCFKHVPLSSDFKFLFLNFHCSTALSSFF